DDAEDTARSAWVFRFTDEGEGQGVKNGGSVRRIPVHLALIERGLIEFIRKRVGQKRIFAMALDSRGREGANFGKWFGKYLRRSCEVKNARMTFHSFRHTFKDICRARGITEEVHDALTGHASGKVSRQVYGGLTYPLAPLVEAMDRYRVQGLELPTPVMQTP
ncbi:MAG: integrase, partial [Bacillota bacterium]